VRSEVVKVDLHRHILLHLRLEIALELLQIRRSTCKNRKEKEEKEEKEEMEETKEGDVGIVRVAFGLRNAEFEDVIELLLDIVDRPNKKIIWK